MIIYKTTNLINNKIYIGQDRNNNPNYYGSGKILHLAIKRYGRNNFVKEILEYCQTLEELNEKEAHWIKILNSTDKKIGYNIRLGGDYNGGYMNISGAANPMYGKTHTEEARRRIGNFNRKTLEEKMGKERSDKLKKHYSKIRKGSGNHQWHKDVPRCCCIFCKKEVDIRNFKRWHFKKCI